MATGCIFLDSAASPHHRLHQRQTLASRRDRLIRLRLHYLELRSQYKRSLRFVELRLERISKALEATTMVEFRGR
jgi:hypothetical protein